MRSQQKPDEKSTRRSPPATTPESRENQLASLAYDLVEKRLRNGTASSQETTHFLKAVSTQARLEKEIMEKQKQLLDAKTDSIKSVKRQEELFVKALDAMRSYSGNPSGEEYD